MGGAIEEFYQPTATMVDVLPADDDYCKFKQFEALMNASNGTGIVFADITPSPTMQEMPKIIIDDWKFEYYLIGGAVTICLLIVIDQIKQRKHDRLLAALTA